MLTGLHGLYLPFIDCLVFGAILSSTDPVTILSIFHQMKVDPKLYAIIFGESILNDSVAIVLFGTLGSFRGKAFTAGSFFHGVASFVGVFSGSVLIGVSLALVCALLLKHSTLFKYPSLESCIVSLIAYSSYLLSNALQLSGIVSLLFCGITLKHYAYDNMSVRSQRTTKYMFRVLSQLSENFIFIYLGVTLFTKRDEAFYPGLIFSTLIIIMVARYFSTIPLARLINWVNRRWGSRSVLRDAYYLNSSPSRVSKHSDDVIPPNHQMMLWWAGLRGAIAFALSYDVEGPSGTAIRTTTLVVCVVSIVVLGGTTNFALEYLKIRVGVSTKKSLPSASTNQNLATGIVEESESSDDESDGVIDDLKSPTNRQSRWSNDQVTSIDGLREYEIEDVPVMRQSSHDLSHWFLGFDSKWLKPLFTQTGFRRNSRNNLGRSKTIRDATGTQRQHRGSGDTHDGLLSFVHDDGWSSSSSPMRNVAHGKPPSNSKPVFTHADSEVTLDPWVISNDGANNDGYPTDE